MTDATMNAPVAQGTRPQMMPRARSRGDGVAPLRNNPAAVLHLVLFIAGAVLLPAGLIIIGLGWYGAAHTPYEYDQMPYLISGGILGLGITFVGGFLYFGAWLARIAADQKEAQRQLSDTLLLLADAVSHASASASASTPSAPVVPAAPVVASEPVAAPIAAPMAAPGRPAAAPPRPRDPGAVLVVAGNGSIVHRADCDLIAGRDDLVPAGPEADNMTQCRLCRR